MFTSSPQWKMQPLALADATLSDAFWAPRQETNRKATLSAAYHQCKKTGRFDAWKLAWKPGQPHKPHIFWDSDVAKWLEAVAHSLIKHKDPSLYRRARNVIELICKAQEKDGYLNTHFQVVRPKARWTNLTSDHELYCAGHLMEAAVAWHEATCENDFLETLCRYADYIDTVFGPRKGQRRGYPGHQEIELALIKLFKATGKKRYLDLAAYFINERGRRPNYFVKEARQRGKSAQEARPENFCTLQAHLPVREQHAAVGHAVRAMYLYAGMADLAGETGDSSLLQACRRLWKSVTQKRMYLTGSVGSLAQGERFSEDFHLPNETAYAETCAAIGLVFWAHRMLQFEADGRYADIMERALYNGVLSGVSQDGVRFFYENPLASDPKNPGSNGKRQRHERQPWFGTSCCPTNIARLLASLGKYAYSQQNRTAWVHLFIQGEGHFSINNQAIRIQQTTRYPYGERIRFCIDCSTPTSFTLALRIPSWCPSASLKVNGRSKPISRLQKKGYVKLARTWKKGDRVELELPMTIRYLHAHPRAKANLGRVALQRGPLVYCFEEKDNGRDLEALQISKRTSIRTQALKTLGGAVALKLRGQRENPKQWPRDSLYATPTPQTKPVQLMAVPYALWNNRGKGEMQVWMREAR